MQSMKSTGKTVVMLTGSDLPAAAHSLSVGQAFD